jgi:hypothetical protein
MTIVIVVHHRVTMSVMAVTWHLVLMFGDIIVSGFDWDEDSPLCSTKTATTNIIVCCWVATLQLAMWHLESYSFVVFDVAGACSVGDMALPHHIR